RWITPIAETPNNVFFPVDTTRDWFYKVVGSYELPWGLYTSAFFQHLSGDSRQRTYVFRSADPAGGTPLRQLATVTVPLEPFGARRLPNLRLLNWRASKRFSLRRGQQIEVDADLFNALNINSATSLTSASGPTFDAIGGIVPPRVLRISASFSF